MIRDRIEAAGRSVDLDEALEARIADPLWMLARQWQLGEFRGDDAAQVAAVSVRAGSAPISRIRARRDEEWRELPGGALLEEVVEAVPPQAHGLGGTLESARLGARVLDAVQEVSPAAAEALAGAFPLELPDDAIELRGSAAAAARLLARRAVDGTALLAARPRRIERVLGQLDEAERGRVDEVLAMWRPRDDPGTWRPHRMEHRFEVGAATDGAALVLTADEYPGGRLDWYSFDIDPAASGAGSSRSLTRTEVALLPAPVRFAGMPASRWWEFEDAWVHFGNLDNGPGDLAAMAVAEYATLYSDDWFVVPLRLEVGTVARVLRLETVDTFGRRQVVSPASLLDDAEGGERPFRMFELHGDPHVAERRAPWLLLPGVVATATHGPPLERVELVRDEGANVAWAIERTVEGPLGRAIDRGESWFASRSAEGAPPGGENGEGPWRYRVEAELSPWWIPLVPQRVAAGEPATHLRRGRMSTWDLLDDRHVGVKGLLLEPGSPLSIEEEEVTRSGAHVERTWQLARDRRGRVRVWLQRSKTNGRGERSSGLRWDLVDR